MANENSGLNAAKRNKNDVFYTQIIDIERELRHCRSHFKRKTVYCNCDAPLERGCANIARRWHAVRGTAHVFQLKGFF